MAAISNTDGSEVQTSEIYNGGGTRQIRHHIPTEEGEVRIMVNVSRGRSAASVRVFTYHHGRGPNTCDRIGSAVILDGWYPHGTEMVTDQTCDVCGAEYDGDMAVWSFGSAALCTDHANDVTGRNSDK